MIIKIKEIDLVSIAIAAEFWFNNRNQKSHKFEKELAAATALKKALYKVNWDEDAELFIDELPI